MRNWELALSIFPDGVQNLVDFPPVPEEDNFFLGSIYFEMLRSNFADKPHVVPWLIAITLGEMVRELQTLKPRPQMSDELRKIVETAECEPMAPSRERAVADIIIAEHFQGFDFVTGASLLGEGTLIVANYRRHRIMAN